MNAHQCMSWSTWRWYKQTQLNNFDTLPFWLWTVLHSNFRKPMLSFHYLASHNVVIKICEFQQFLTVNSHIITRDYNCLLVAIHLPDDGLIGIWLHLFAILSPSWFTKDGSWPWVVADPVFIIEANISSANDYKLISHGSSNLD